MWPHYDSADLYLGLQQYEMFVVRYLNLTIHYVLTGMNLVHNNTDMVEFGTVISKCTPYDSSMYAVYLETRVPLPVRVCSRPWRRTFPQSVCDSSAGEMEPSPTLRSRTQETTTTFTAGRSLPPWLSWCSITWSITGSWKRKTEMLLSSSIRSTVRTRRQRGEWRRRQWCWISVFWISSQRWQKSTHSSLQ